MTYHRSAYCTHSTSVTTNMEPGGQKFCLKWNQFNHNLKSSLSRMRDCQDLTDVAILCEDGTRFLSHRLILAACSSFFKQIFLMNDNANAWVYLKGVESAMLRFLLEFVYVGEVEVPEQSLAKFLETAHELKIKGLAKYVGNSTRLSKEEDQQEPVWSSPEVKVETEPNIDVPEQTLREEDELDDEEPKEMVIVEEEHQAEAAPNEGPVFSAEVNAELDKQIEEILVKNDGVWTCKVCGKFANHKSKLKQHVETHIDGFSHPCGLCGKSYRSRNVLRMHLSRDHKNKKSINSPNNIYI